MSTEQFTVLDLVSAYAAARVVGIADVKAVETYASGFSMGLQTGAYLQEHYEEFMTKLIEDSGSEFGDVEARGFMEICYRVRDAERKEVSR